MNILIVSKDPELRAPYTVLKNTGLQVKVIREPWQICGSSPDVIIVDKEYGLTEQDMDTLLPAIYDGVKETGKIIEL